MTVAELIRALAVLDPDTSVWVRIPDTAELGTDIEVSMVSDVEDDLDGVPVILFCNPT